MKRSIRLGIVFMILLVSLNATAQNSDNINLQSYIPKSPNSSELEKYGEIPVGLNTGVPDISFPLYEVRSGSLTLPITLSYHASGIQVNQRATDVGLGWCISAGGQITREVHGIPDDAHDKGAYGYFYYTPPSYQALMGLNNYDTLTQYIQSSAITNTTTAYMGGTFWGHDLEPDVFQYSMCRKSGKFIYNIQNSFTTIPFEPVKIEKYLDVSNQICFKITDESGTIYDFSKYTTTSSYSGAPSPCESFDSYVSSWYLTSITSADLTDVITIEYETANIRDFVERDVSTIGSIEAESSDNVNISETEQQVLQTPPDCAGFTNIKTTVIDYNELRVKKIHFKNGYIAFTRNTTRQDEMENTLHNNYALDNISVYDNQDKLIKNIVFNKDYFTAQPTTTENWKNYRLKLTGFVETNQSQTIKKVYKFDYDLTALPYYGSYAVDYWGYYNGEISNGDLIPQRTYSYGDLYSKTINDLNGYTSATATNKAFSGNYTFLIGHANRESSASYLEAGMLNKITYPTGGYTQFEYEPHQYLSQGQAKIGGGIRIRSIKSYTADNVLSKEDYYKYGNNEDGYGITVYNDYFFYKDYEDEVSYYPSCWAANQGLDIHQDILRWRRNFLGISKYNSTTFNGNPITYDYVAKYTNANNLNGKTTYKFDFNTQFQELLPDEFVSGSNYGFHNNAWHGGELLEETIYKYDNNSFIPVSTVQNEYTEINPTANDAVLFKQTIALTVDPNHWQLRSFNGYQNLNDFAGNFRAKIVPPFGYFSIWPYQNKTGAYLKTKETKTIYSSDNNPANNLVTVTSLQYQNPLNCFLTEASTLQSNGTTQITRYKYPHDYSDPVSNAMVSKNILSPPLEETVYKSVSGTETLLSTTQTAYKQIGNLIVRDNIKASIGNLTPETRIVFNQYDSNNGNILEQQKANGPYESYQWGYNGEYAVAEAKNATNNDIFYDSFEEGNGNGALGDAKTGHLSYSGTYSKSLTSLDAGSYIVSYWLKNPATGVWSMIVNAPVTISGTSYTITIPTGQIDDVRFYPANAEMATYTYDPLVGMTSSTDAKGETIYYEYDAFQRLMNIKDKDGNVIKHMDYHYQGQ